ncbi:MAG TPA: terminase small subunit [Sphingobacterium sp.]|nr:terminase small subunit [Sphingobacterium sp.]
MLTQKQKRFCEEYLIDLNATQAAIRAGYSQKTARAIGQENLTKPDIQVYIAELQQKVSERTNITVDMVVKELARIGFSDITSYLKVRGTRNKKFVEIFNTDKLSEDQTAAISEIKQTKEGISLKLHNKTEALTKLGMHIGMFVNKSQFIGKDGEPLDNGVLQAVIVLPSNGREVSEADTEG